MRFFALAMIVLGVTTSAVADDRSVAREHFVTGTKAFDLGLYDEAIAEYMAAYKIKDHPALLYNIAQSHRLAGHAAEALRFYRVYLQKLPDSPNRAEVEAKVAELERLLEQQKKAQTMPPDQVRPPTPATEPARAAAVAPPTPSAAAPIAPAPAIDLRAGRKKEIAGLAVGVVGVAALVAGAALEAMAKRASDELTALDAAGGRFDAGKAQAGQLEGNVGVAMLAVGGAALVAGAVVAVLGLRDRKAARAVVSASGAGLRFAF